MVRMQILVGVLAVFATVNIFYFLKILPPLPLALADAGVYHSVKKVGNVYQAVEEPQAWTTYYGLPPLLHLQPSDRLLDVGCGAMRGGGRVGPGHEPGVTAGVRRAAREVRAVPHGSRAYATLGPARNGWKLRVTAR